MDIGKFFGIKKNEQTGSAAKAKRNKVPRTVQQTIPYVAAYCNGIIEVDYGRFSKTYLLKDINFRTASQETQETLFQKICEALNALSDTDIQFSCMNRTVSEDEFRSNYLLEMKGDDYNKYRSEINSILIDHLHEGNGIVSEKYVTLTITANNIDDATAKFARIDANAVNAFQSVTGSDANPLDLQSRMNILYRAYHPDDEGTPHIDVEDLRKQGITTKDVIGPDSIKVVKDHIEIGDTYSTVLYMTSYPSILSTEFISELNEIPCRMISSIHMSAIQQDKATTLVRHQITNINANLVQLQKKASKSGYSPELVSPDTMAAKDEAMQLLEDITANNQRLFYVTVVVQLYGKTMEELAEYIKMAQSIGHKYMCVLNKLSYQQEIGMASALPIGRNNLEVTRLLTNESAALFVPYSSMTINHKGGFYYGLNAVSGSMIIYDRRKAKNANGVILGTSGSGKSFSAKREIFSVLLGSDADVYVVDPDGEYAALARELGGNIVRIAAGEKTYINPLDMDIQYADDDEHKQDPITLKSDFMCSFCETAIGGRYGLSPVERSVIDRCVRTIYGPYMEYMQQHPELNIDTTKTPTLIDFYETLIAQPEPEAQNIALGLELYCTGSLDTFAHQTNVITNSRFTVYDIKDMGAGLYQIGLQVCLNDIWNRTIANKSKGKETWFYLDEFYLLVQNESSAKFLQQIYKRARKWGGVPTGITQDVEDLLTSRECRAILNNSDFVMMLNQSPIGRTELAKMYNISPALQSHITDVKHGHGLLYTGTTILPFDDKYPENTESFKAMNSNMRKEI